MRPSFKLARRFCGISAIKFALCFPLAAVMAESFTVTVPATPPFTNSGVTLLDGQRATLTASGTISYGSLGPTECQTAVKPVGCKAEKICQFSGNCGALFAKIGGNAVFPVGRHKQIVGPGLIELGVNDKESAYGDNSGAFSVVIKIVDPTVSGNLGGTAGGIEGTGVEVTGFTLTERRIRKTVSTDAFGDYTVVLPPGSYAISPKVNDLRFPGKFQAKNAPSGYKRPFTPFRKVVRVKKDDIEDVNFTAVIFQAFTGPSNRIVETTECSLELADDGRVQFQGLPFDSSVLVNSFLDAPSFGSPFFVNNVGPFESVERKKGKCVGKGAREYTIGIDAHLAIPDGTEVNVEYFHD